MVTGMNQALSSTVPRIRLTSTEEMLAAVPYLVGFQPVDSIVILVFRDAKLQVGARMDISAVGHPAEFESMIDSLRRRYPDLSAAVFVYCEDPFAGLMACDEVIHALRECDIIEAARVHGQRFWPLLCECPACECDGHPFDADDTMVAASAVAAGLQVVDSREQAVRAAAGPSGDELAIVTQRHEAAQARLTGQTVAKRRARLRSLLSAGGDSPHALTDDEVAELAILVDQSRIRDEAFTVSMLAAPGAYHELWRRVVAQCPDRWAVGALCLLGIAAWRLGHGALLSECVERASRIAPNDSWVEFLTEVIHDVVPPQP